MSVFENFEAGKRFLFIGTLSIHQLLFSFHCCLHLSGELTSIGRLDQLLEPFLKETPTNIGHFYITTSIMFDSVLLFKNRLKALAKRSCK